MPLPRLSPALALQGHWWHISRGQTGRAAVAANSLWVPNEAPANLQHNLLGDPDRTALLPLVKKQAGESPTLCVWNPGPLGCDLSSCIQGEPGRKWDANTSLPWKDGWRKEETWEAPWTFLGARGREGKRSPANLSRVCLPAPVSVKGRLVLSAGRSFLSWPAWRS